MDNTCDVNYLIDAQEQKRKDGEEKKEELFEDTNKKHNH